MADTSLKRLIKWLAGLRLLQRDFRVGLATSTDQLSGRRPCAGGPLGELASRGCGSARWPTKGMLIPAG
jgi:hypothetical protein